MTTTDTSDFSLTDELARKIQENPRNAVQFAAELLRAKDRTDRDRAVAASALARGLLDMGEQSRAASIASQAVSLSVDCGDDAVAFRVRLGAAVVLAESGHVNEALAALDDETGPLPERLEPVSNELQERLGALGYLASSAPPPGLAGGLPPDPKDCMPYGPTEGVPSRAPCVPPTDRISRR